MILAVDVGGTNTRLALIDEARGEPRVMIVGVYRSRDHASLEQIVSAFLLANPATLSGACVGVAGPVREGRAVLTNLPWGVDASVLAAHLRLPEIGLINDLE